MLRQSQNSSSADNPEKKRNKSANNPNEKGYIRLYNLRNQKEKTNLLKSPQMQTANNQTNIKKKPLQERDQYLQNLYKEGLYFIEKIESGRSKFLKDEKNQMKLNTNFAWAENNKFFLEKVMQIFRLALKSFTQAENKLENTNNNNNIMYEIDEENKLLKEEEKFKEKTDFDKNELKKFLFEFGITTLDFSQEEEKNNNLISLTTAVENNNASSQRGSTAAKNNEKPSLILTGKENIRSSANAKKLTPEEAPGATANKPKSPSLLVSKKTSNKKEKEKINLQLQEKSLVNMLVNNIIPTNESSSPSGAEAKLSSNDLFLHLIGILNLYDYFIYSSYKKTNPLTYKKKAIQEQSKIKKHQKLPKTEEEMSLKSQIICEIKEEIKQKALKQLRYASFDSENKLIITEENANNLKKDFHMFYLNFMLRHNMKSNSMQILKAGLESEFKQHNTFKPKIDENSRKLYSDYKRKMNVNDSNKIGVEGAKGDLTNQKEHMEYLDNLILGKKKKEK